MKMEKKHILIVFGILLLLAILYYQKENFEMENFESSLSVYYKDPTNKSPPNYNAYKNYANYESGSNVDNNTDLDQDNQNDQNQHQENFEQLNTKLGEKLDRWNGVFSVPKKEFDTSYLYNNPRTVKVSSNIKRQFHLGVESYLIHIQFYAFLGSKSRNSYQIWTAISPNRNNKFDLNNLKATKYDYNTNETTKDLPVTFVKLVLGTNSNNDMIIIKAPWLPRDQWNDNDNSGVWRFKRAVSDDDYYVYDSNYNRKTLNNYPSEINPKIVPPAFSNKMNPANLKFFKDTQLENMKYLEGDKCTFMCEDNARTDATNIDGECPYDKIVCAYNKKCAYGKPLCGVYSDGTKTYVNNTDRTKLFRAPQKPLPYSQFDQGFVREDDQENFNNKTNSQCIDKNYYMTPEFIYFLNPRTNKILSFLSSAPGSNKVFLDMSRMNLNSVIPTPQQMNDAFGKSRPPPPDYYDGSVDPEDTRNDMNNGEIDNKRTDQYYHYDYNVSNNPADPDDNSSYVSKYSLPTKWSIEPFASASDECLVYIRSHTRNASKQPHYYLELSKQNKLTVSLYGGKESQLFRLVNIANYESFKLYCIVPLLDENMRIKMSEVSGYRDGSLSVECSKFIPYKNKDIQYLLDRNDTFAIIRSKENKK